MNNDVILSCYTKYHKELLLYAYSLTNNIEDAKDLVADAFVKAILSYDKEDLKPWLYVVIRNAFYTQSKKKKRWLHVDSEIIPSDQNIVEDLIKDEHKRWLYRAITNLPQREQEVMLLSLDDSLKDQDIATLTNLSIDNIRVIRHRAKEKLKKEWNHENITR